MYRPLVSFSFGWIIGLGLANYVPLDFYGYLALLIGTSCCLFYCKYMKGLAFILCLFGVSFGSAYFTMYNQLNISAFPEPITTVGIGKIETKPVIDGDQIRFDIKLEQINRAGTCKKIKAEKIRITTIAKHPEGRTVLHSWYSSCRIQLPLQLERPSSARNPGGFDYALYLHHYRTHWQAHVPALSQIQLVGCESLWLTPIERLRQSFHDRIEQLYPAEQAGILFAMLIGEQATLDDTTQEIFSTLGLIHVLSISGLHVSILVAALYFLLLACRLTREKAALLIIVFLPFYAILTGSSAPVIRSVIMAGMILVAVLWRQTSDAVSFLGLALLVQLLWNPYQLWEPGFQLSFLVTAGLLLYVEPLSDHIPVKGHRMRQALAVMIVSQVVSFPVVAAYFYQFAWLAGPVNVIFSPIYSAVILPLSTVSLLVSYLSFGWGNMIAKLTSWLMGVIDQGLTWISEIPYMVYAVPPPTIGWIICYFAVVGFTYVAIVTDRAFVGRLRYVSLSALVVFLYLLVASAGPNDETRITVIDVGQGDAILIETAEGKVILIDAGGTLPMPEQAWQKQRTVFEVGRDLLVPYLRYRGINHIDAIVMTHGDGDHIRGMPAVIERISVGEVWHSNALSTDDFERALLVTLHNKQIPVRAVRAGDRWNIEEGIQVQMLHPPDVITTKSANDASVVMLLSICHTNLLLTGDMEQQAEEAVLATYDFPPIHLLKIAHHGSKTSTTDAWLKAVKPQHALISAGVNNRYGHPHPDVVARLRQYRAQIWRTDQQGAIVIMVDQSGYRVMSEL